MSFMTFVAPRVLGTMLYAQKVLQCVLADLIRHVHNLVQYSTHKALRL